jgi:hypothetical protein
MLLFYIILENVFDAFSNNWVAINKPGLSIINPDSSHAFQWAIVLTDPAANTQVSQYRWAFNRARLPPGINHISFFQADGFLRGGAHLLTYDAGHPTCPW